MTSTMLKEAVMVTGGMMMTFSMTKKVLLNKKSAKVKKRQVEDGVMMTLILVTMIILLKEYSKVEKRLEVIFLCLQFLQLVILQSCLGARNLLIAPITLLLVQQILQFNYLIAK
mmetsp:Transcript_53428/g.148572  ORF Transcript_53428/g.148572 Transcript_53428/m.148572 type:complete len:114 (-) Transcript_53428:868-1209(-)